MTTTIDNRAVEMQFTNADFERGVKESLSTLDKLKKALNLEGSTKGLSQIENKANNLNLSGLGNAVSSLSERFSTMGIISLSIINNIISRLFDMGVAIARTFLIDPISTGFSEYELKLNSVQTIMAGTGESLQVVTKYLNELNTYADKTIYSFSDMTTNIGKFTNAGVSLDQSVNAIKGIANVAAVSGANAGEASRAMYNFAQALSAGYVKLIDWKSIELANMGTVEFKQQLIDSAVAIGTLVETTSGYYETLEGNALSASKNFNETLTDQWLTTDVLVSTLNRYSNANTDIGKKATAAAQDVKSLTLLMDTLKEAAQSGWAETWELILGNFDEAKVFMTHLSNVFGGIIGQAADARNALVGEWKEFGGRTAMVESIKNLLEIILNIAKPIGEAMKQIFPPVTGKRLAELTQGLYKFLLNFKMASQNLEPLKRIARGIFSVIDIGRIILTSFFKELLNFVDSFGVSGSLPGIVEFIARIGDLAFNLRNSIKSASTFTNAFKSFFDFLRPIVTGIVGLFVTLVNGIKGLKDVNLKDLKFLKGDFSAFARVFEKFGNKIKEFSKLGGVLNKMVKVFLLLKEKLDPVRKALMEKAGEAIHGILEGIEKAIDKLDVDKVLKVINGGLFAAILIGIKGLGNKAKEAVGTGMFAAILAAIKNFIDNAGGVFTGVKDILEGVKDTLETYQKSLKADILLKIAYALGIMALSLIALSFIDSERLAASLAALSLMLFELFLGLESFSKGVGGIKDVATSVAALIGISLAVAILAGALVALSVIDPQNLTNAIIALTILFAELLAFVKFSQKGDALSKMELGMLILASAMFVLAKTLNIFGEMPLNQVGVGLLAMAGALTIISLAMNALPVNLAERALGLLGISVALLILSQALKLMGQLSPDQLGMGLGAMAGSLLILVIALNAMTSTLAGAAALLIASSALFILGMALTVISKIPLKELGIALGAVAAIFILLGIAGAVLGPTVPVLLGLAAAMFLIGVGALALGAGMLAFSIGMATLATAGAAGIAALGAVITLIVGFLPKIAEGLGKAIVTFIQTVANSGAVLLESFVKMIRTALSAITIVVPELVTAGFEILLAFLKGIRDNIGEITEVAFDIVVNFLDAITLKLPELIQSGWDLILNLINGMTDSIEENLPLLIEASIDLGKAIIEGIIEGIEDLTTELWETVGKLGEAILSRLRQILGIESPSTETREIGRYFVEGFVEGLRRNKRFIFSEIESFASESIDAFGQIIQEISDAINADMDISPTIKPVVDLDNVRLASEKMKKYLPYISPAILDATVKRGSLISPKQEEGSLIHPDAPKSISDINITQNNYSPKPLNQYEIYRLTRIQLLEAQKLGGVT